MQKNGNDYQVLARRYRPQTFEEVLGQGPIVTTLKNAIKNKRLAHAYLFCGSRGTGKTTLARLFAKALNCLNRNEKGEPCNQCASCKEITSGHSLDVLEIDGASHRGIDDVRQINETVGYAAAHGGYKIYIIDEVHMLTKEAFNALLKTLEEPPPKVMFFFATTEPHKVLPTILSRCQRFNLSRISNAIIIGKLQSICADLGIIIQEEALQLIADHAEGGLRDAESLLDQIISFHEGEITLESVASLLGLMPQDVFFALDQAGKAGNLAMAFDIVHQIFSQGKDINHFVESLTEHFRHILRVKLGDKTLSFAHLSEKQRAQYEMSAKMYTQEQVLNILEDLIPAQTQIRFMSSSRMGLEAILLKILRSHQRIPIEFLVRRLAELEQSAVAGASSPQPTAPTPIPSAPPSAAPSQAPKSSSSIHPSISIDPHPTPRDLGKKNNPSLPSTVIKGEPPPLQRPEQLSAKLEKPAAAEPPPKLSAKEQHRLDTLLQFAAVELEGTIYRKF
jgi:DNA polymerase-3 subunit gamma/tau